MSRKHSRIIALAAASVVGAASLTSCSSPADDGDVTITWWATNLASSLERDNELLKPMIDRFTEKTGIKVDVEVNSWADYYNKVLGAVSSGEGPDVMSIGTTWTQTLADTGAFLPIEGDTLDAVGGADKFVPASFAAAGGDRDNASFVPMVNGVTNLWYNPKIFAAAGISEAPRTWDEFVSVAKTLTQDTDGDGSIDQYGFAYPAGSAQELSHTIFAVGEQFDGQMFDKDGNPTLDSDGIVEAATMLTGLMTNDQIMSTADVETATSTETFQDFIDGKIGMMFGSNPLPTFEDAGFTDFAPGYIPVLEPAIGKPIQTHIAGVNIGVFAETKQREAALEFVKYLTDEAAQVDYYNDFDLLPVNQSTYDSDEVEKTPTFEIYADVLANYAETFPLNSKTGQAETLIGDAMKQLFAQAALDGPITEEQARQVLSTANDQLKAAG